MVYHIDFSDWDKAEKQFNTIDRVLHNDDETREALQRRVDKLENKNYQLEKRVVEYELSEKNYERKL